MTPIEQSLYGCTRFRIDDEVEIAGELVGTVTGIKVTTSGEDEYRVFYFDNCDNPQERWIRDSMLDVAEDEPESNVIPFPGREAPTVAARRAAIAEARNATKH